MRYPKYSPEERIQQYLEDKTGTLILDKDDEARLRAYIRCDQLIKERLGSRWEIMPILMKEFGIGFKTALHTFENTPNVMGKNKNEYYLEIMLAKSSETLRKAELKGDEKTVAKIQKDMIEAIGKYFPQNNEIDYEQINAPDLLIGQYPETLNLEPVDRKKLLLRIEQWQKVGLPEMDSE